jgi:chemotaxis protein CheC
MTELGAQVREADIDRVRELTSIGAGHAATAFARLVGRPCQMCVPAVRLLRAESAALPFVVNLRDDERHGMTGIFFEIEGGLGGIVAILFSAASRDQLLEHLTGIPTPESTTAVSQSALREFGNILVSHVVSPMADALGVAILPSIPVLAMEDALEVLGSLIGLRQKGRPALRIETEISDRHREFQSLLVFVPDSTTIVSIGRPFKGS